MKQPVLIGGQNHSISRTWAKKHGVTAAFVLGYLRYKIERSQHVHEGKRWYYETIDGVAQHYPYLGRTAIHKAIKRLTTNAGPLITGNFNKRKYDRTTWYALRNETDSLPPKSDYVWFNVMTASIHGIPEAVILRNLAYWISYNRGQNANNRFQAMSPNELSKVMPFSRSTIQRALDHLLEDRILLWRRGTDTRKATEYCFAHKEDLDECLAGPKANRPSFEVMPANKGDSEILPAQTRITNMAGSNPNMAGSNPNMTSPNANDYTILKDNPLKDDCLEKSLLKENIAGLRHRDVTSSTLSLGSLANDDASTIGSWKQLS